MAAHNIMRAAEALDAEYMFNTDVAEIRNRDKQALRMKNSENFRILWECAEPIGAAVSACRGTVDAGWAPHSMQAGQTGATVCPEVYIACGISGAVQHFCRHADLGLDYRHQHRSGCSHHQTLHYFAVAD